MKDGVAKLLSYCAGIDFGPVHLTTGRKEFRSELNHEIVLLCQSLPESTKTDALLFLMELLGASFGNELDFLRIFYVPTWSVLYWLREVSLRGGGLDRRDMRDAKVAHCMAMLLHVLDDRLNDRDLEVTPLSLLLRAQAWMHMDQALTRLSARVDRGKDAVRGFVNDYYSTICGSEIGDSMDRYCDAFRKQMALWLIVPVLLGKKMSADDGLPAAVESAYGSFGIAWRLLDDIKDVREDMKRGVHSSVYIHLPGSLQALWDHKGAGQKAGEDGDEEMILDYIFESRIMDRIRETIDRELESAAFTAERFGIEGLAEELRLLSMPLKNGQD